MKSFIRSAMLGALGALAAAAGSATSPPEASGAAAFTVPVDYYKLPTV